MMKRTILTGLVILIVVFTVLAFLGRGSEYIAEKLLYKTLEEYAVINANPEVSPPRMIAKVEKGLIETIDRFPDANASKMAYIKLVELYLISKQYDKVTRACNEIIEKYKDDIPFLSQVYFALVVANEASGRWDKSLVYLKILRDEYFTTPLGLQAPLYTARYYERKGMKAEAAKEYGEAVSFYTELSKEKHGTMFGYAASSVLIQAYMGIQAYEAAGKAVEDTIKAYPTAMTLVQILPYVELIYVSTLNDRRKAADIYRYIRERTSDKRLKKLLYDKIVDLKIDGYNEQLETDN
ncbi:MAG: hypothetical protein ABID09_08590 [Candidatus Omnitrophota bacterium]